MQQQPTAQGEGVRPGRDLGFASHEVRLCGRQWLVAGLILLAVFVATPGLWERGEEFAPSADYRVPYGQSADYWHFARYCRRVAAQGRTAVLGDSVVWAQYVEPDGSLTHFLNEAAGGERFANMGVDGAHPAALAGLIQHYGGALAAGKVVLHCNPLWMSSEKRDLSVREALRFNHTRLVPQLYPRVPCYRATYSQRLGVLVERAVPFLSWVGHLQAAYFDQKDIPSWTLDHPYRCPVSALTRGPGAPPARHYDASPWTAKGIGRQDFPWVALDASFQWRSFRKAVAILRQRGNDVFVLVGPFNEHMLTPASRERYEGMRDGIVAWLRAEGIPYAAPPPLPSALYADASHPLREGYALLARQLLDDDAFARFIER